MGDGEAATETEVAATHPAAGIFRRWLRHGTGCLFASHLATAEEIGWQAFREPPPAVVLDQVYDFLAPRRRCAVTLLTGLRSESALAHSLKRLCAGSDRWTLRRRSARVRDGAVMVGIEWRTAAGATCDVMGFGPLGELPVTRRAPYVALSLWPGGRENPYRPSIRHANQVGFIDAAHALDKEQHDELWRRTEDQVATMLENTPGDGVPRVYRNVAFVMSEEGARVLGI